MSMPKDYAAMDLETTGLNPRLDKIIEIGAVRVRDGVVTDTFCTYVNPGKAIPKRVTELTGISDGDVADAPYIEEVMPQFMEFLGEDILLGHNIIFDYSFVKKAAANQKLAFEREGIDTLRIARRFLTELKSRNLGFLCSYYQIPLEEAHRAYHDAKAAHLLYLRLCEEFYDKEAATFLPKKLLYGVKKEVPMTPRQKSYILGLAKELSLTIENGQITLPEVLVSKLGDKLDMEHMTKNEAGRLIDCLLSRKREITARTPADCEE